MNVNMEKIQLEQEAAEEEGLRGLDPALPAVHVVRLVIRVVRKLADCL